MTTFGVPPPKKKLVKYYSNWVRKGLIESLYCLISKFSRTPFHWGGGWGGAFSHKIRITSPRITFIYFSCKNKITVSNGYLRRNFISGSWYGELRPILRLFSLWKINKHSNSINRGRAAGTWWNISIIMTIIFSVSLFSAFTSRKLGKNFTIIQKFSTIFHTF